MFGSFSCSHACNSDIMSRVPNGKLPRAGHQFPLKMEVFFRGKNPWHFESECKGCQFQFQLWSCLLWKLSGHKLGPKILIHARHGIFSKWRTVPHQTPNPPTAHSKATHAAGGITKHSKIKSDQISVKKYTRIEAKGKVQATPVQRRGIKEIQAHHSIAKAKTTLRCQALLTTSGIRPGWPKNVQSPCQWQLRRPWLKPWSLKAISQNSSIQKETSSTQSNQLRIVRTKRNHPLHYSGMNL